MPRFDRNDITLTEKVIDEKVKLPQVGIVSQVYEHSSDEDDSNWEADIEINGQSDELTRVPIHTPGSGIISPPKNGDKLLVIYRNDMSKRPVALGTGWSNTDRPPAGKAGMYRNEVESDTSPLGDGNLNLTTYTSYNESAASNDKRQLTPQESFVQITKHAEGENINPSSAGAVPAKIEMYDSPVAAKDESHIHIEGNQVDGDDKKGLDVKLDFKTGVLTVRGENDGDTYEIKIDVKNETMRLVGDSDAGNLMGATFDFNGNTFKIADGNGYGIESDGSGNFTWSHNTINYKEDNGSINL